MSSRGDPTPGRINKSFDSYSAQNSQEQVGERSTLRAKPYLADSAYHSMRTSMNASNVTLNRVTTQAQSEAFEIHGTDLLIYKKKPHSKEALGHGHSVRYAIEGKIQEDIFAKDPSRRRDVGLEFRMVGKTFDTATLHILIFCSPELEEPLEAILQLPVVTELRRSSRENVPRLDILVITKPINRTSDKITVDACGQRAFFARHSTYCGSPVILRTSMGQPSQTPARKATFGGVLKVTYGSGDINFYGMTAGHAVEEMLQECTAILSGSLTGPSAKRDGFHPSEWIADDDMLGRVLLAPAFPGVAASHSTLTHDWALFDVADPLPNMIPRMQHTSHHELDSSQDQKILIAAKPHFSDGISADVQLLGAAEGPSDGELSSLPARLWLAHNERFVDAYMLELSHNDGKNLSVLRLLYGMLTVLY